jgi:hypothetical protein
MTDECILEAFLFNAFASIVLGFWYFTAFTRTFCVSFKQIPEGKEKMDTINEGPIMGRNTLIGSY